MTELERDQTIRRELVAGNVPSFLRNLQPVTLSTQLAGGETVRLTLCVLADYLSLGDDGDFLLVPMGLTRPWRLPPASDSRCPRAVWST